MMMVKIVSAKLVWTEPPPFLLQMMRKFHTKREKNMTIKTVESNNGKLVIVTSEDEIAMDRRNNN